MKKILDVIISSLVILGALWGAYQYFEHRYASAEDVAQIEQRLDYKIVSDKYYSTQERIWKIHDRCGKNPTDPTVKEQLRTLELQLEELKTELNKFEKGLKKK